MTRYVYLLFEGFTAHRAFNEHFPLLENHLRPTEEAEAYLASGAMVVCALNASAAGVAGLSKQGSGKRAGPMRLSFCDFLEELLDQPYVLVHCFEVGLSATE